jgi:hypothetical protein
MAYVAWQASTVYAVNDVVCATTQQPSGLVFLCTGAGTSSSLEPSWPTRLGGAANDGSARWIAISSVYVELSKIAPTAIIELFELTLDPVLHGSGTTYYWHAGTNADVTGNIVFGENTYVRIPVEATGFDYTSTGAYPRPVLRVSNVNGDVTALLQSVNQITPGNDLGGAMVKRIRTLKRFLDDENFTIRSEDGISIILENDARILLEFAFNGGN